MRAAHEGLGITDETGTCLSSTSTDTLERFEVAEQEDLIKITAPLKAEIVN